MLARRPRAVLLALGGAMLASALLILWEGRGTSFGGDDLYYYARFVDRNGVYQPAPLGLEYLLAPHNGHLQLLGKLIYEGLFATAGTTYAAFRAVEAFGFVLCVGLFFALARLRVGEAMALVASVLLLFLGSAWEVMLWPFDLHTIYALAAGLGAFLIVDRRSGRAADLACCALLVGSIATIEVGLAFLAGVAVTVLARDDRLRRAWIIAIPLVLYGGWALWARQFGQSELMLSNLSHLATSFAGSLAATVGSLSGLIEAGPGVFATTVGSSGFETVLAALVALALVYRIGHGAVAVSTWALLAVLLTYWAFIALATRAPDSSRYVFVGAVLVLLITADLVSKVTITRAMLIAAIALVGISLPMNLVKLSDGRAAQVTDATASRTEYAMLELARDRVAADYAPALDRRVIDAAPPPFTGLTAGQYFPAAARFGSLAYSLDHVRTQDDAVKRGADASLAGALAVELASAEAPADPASCTHVDAPDAPFPEEFELPAGGALIGSRAPAPVRLGLARFSTAPGFELGELAARSWSALSIPVDSVPERWRAFVDGPVSVCPLPTVNSAP